MTDTLTNKIWTIMEKLTWISFLLLIIECGIGNSGRMIEIGPLSIRMVLFIICLMLSIPQLVRSWREIVHSPYVILFVLFFLWLVVGAVISYLNGIPLSNILTDIQRYFIFLLLPTAIVLINNRRRIKQLVDTIMYTTLVLCGITIVLFILTSSNLFIDEIFHLITDYFESGIGGVNLITENAYRVFLRSHIFLVPALIISLYYSFNNEKPLKYVLFAGIIAFTTLITMTRSIWVGAGASLVLVCILELKRFPLLFKRYCQVLAIVIVLFLCWTLVYGSGLFDAITSLFIPSTAAQVSTNITNPGTAERINSDKTRTNLINIAITTFAQSPIIGKGLAYTVGSGITLRKDGIIEYTYLEILMKSGVIGLLLFLLPFAYLAFCFWRLIQSRKGALVAADTFDAFGHTKELFISVIGVAVVSYFNPFLTNPLGGIFVLLAIGTVNYFYKSRLTPADILLKG